MRLLIIIGLLLSAVPVLAEEGFTHKDRELLIELRVRLEEMDQRFAQVDKRFEQVHTQISDLRQDMNKRFDQMFHFFYILAGIFTSLVVAVTMPKDRPRGHISGTR